MYLQYICIPYKQKYWQTLYLVKNVIGGILNWRYRLLYSKKPMLAYTTVENGVHLIWRLLRDLPNRRIKITVNITAYTVA